MLRYLAMPGIVPRVRAFFGNGFGWIAYLMAMTYQTVRLLPATHPYCQTANIGRFGIRHVIAEAAANLTFDRRHIDQVVIFGAMLLGFVLLMVQCAMIVASLIIDIAYAGPPAPFAGMFNTANPEEDIALMLLWQVFGVPGFFCSNAGVCTTLETSMGGTPTPFHLGLHALFHFYNLAILLVAVLILLYYIVLIVGETAQTGTPFGRRFSHIYAPLRLVLAVGLLVPINYGYNSAQYITFAAARMGSGFATNTWTLFNATLVNPSGMADDSLIARAKAPDVQHLMKFMMIVQACRYAYPLATAPRPGVPPADDPIINIDAYFVNGTNSAVIPAAAAIWDDGDTFFAHQDITIRFGRHDPVAYASEEGYVKPFCGELKMPRIDHTNPRAVEMARAYGVLIGNMWGGAGPVTPYRAFGERAAHMGIEYEIITSCIHDADLGSPGCNRYPDAAWKQATYANEQITLNGNVLTAFTAPPPSTFTLPADLLARGWGGAGIWYNRIAQWNSSWISAVQNIPAPSKLPLPMEQVQSARRGQAANIEPEQRFNPAIGGGVDFNRPEERQIAVLLNQVYNYWASDSALEPTDTRQTPNPFINVISMIFGIDSLFTIRENHDIHPLAQLVALGKGIIDAAVRNLAISIGISAIAGGAEGALGQGAAANATQGLASMFTAFTMIGLTIGFILFYMLPFMPFMYFFFAVGGWLKSVFEAMVGVPLWALAHLKIDGNGLPGDAAMNGYFLIFEIFLRPILTVFGLLAALMIFTAQVRVLHEIFPLVTQNLTGFDGDTSVPGLLYTGLLENLGFEFKRDVVDEFFFTIIYTILVYLLATGSFKLIDAIPNEMLRWMGSGARAFADRRDDPIENIKSYAAIGGYQISSQVTSIASQGASGLGRTGGSMLGSLFGRSGVRATGDGG